MIISSYLCGFDVGFYKVLYTWFINLPYFLALNGFLPSRTMLQNILWWKSLQRGSMSLKIIVNDHDLIEPEKWKP